MGKGDPLPQASGRFKKPISCPIQKHRKVDSRNTLMHPTYPHVTKPETLHNMEKEVSFQTIIGLLHVKLQCRQPFSTSFCFHRVMYFLSHNNISLNSTPRYKGCPVRRDNFVEHPFKSSEKHLLTLNATLHKLIHLYCSIFVGWSTLASNTIKV